MSAVRGGRIRGLPPAVSGVPLLGNLPAYRRDHVQVFQDGYEAHGPIFSLRLGPHRAVVLIGPDLHEFFFREVDRTLSLPEVYRFVIPMFGPVLNASHDPTTRRRQLELVHGAFQGERADRHLAVMAAETGDWLTSLGDTGEFELYDGLSQLGMKIAASAFVGEEVRARMDEFADLFHDLARGMDFVLPPNLPLPRFRRRDRARARLAELIRPAIAAREAVPGGRDDLLQSIVDHRDDGTGAFDEEAVTGLALATLFTGYLTTAAQASWALLDLIRHPDYLELVRAELAEHLPDAPHAVTRHSLGQLERLDRAVKESQRLHPVMSHYARFTAHSYEIGCYEVPAGWMTMVCPAVAHRLPDVFPAPDVYDPDRFAPGAAGRSKHPYALIGFGAGPYRCPGSGFGTSEIKCVLGMLLRRFELRHDGGEPGRSFDMGVIRPAPPCRVAYARRQPAGAPEKEEAYARGC